MIYKTLIIVLFATAVSAGESKIPHWRVPPEPTHIISIQVNFVEDNTIHTLMYDAYSLLHVMALGNCRPLDYDAEAKTYLSRNVTFHYLELNKEDMFND